MAITRTLKKNTNKQTEVEEKKSARKIVLEMRNQLINDMLEELRNKKNDTSPWRKGYVKMNFTNTVSGKDYKGINRFHLMRSARKNGFSDHRWITYNQMKAANEANGDPLYILEKGSKATKIEFHQWITPEEAKERIERQKAKGVEDEMIVKREDGYWVHKYYNVFNAQQFLRFPELEQLSEDVKNAMLDSALENSEAPIHYDQMDKNYYMPAKDEIHLVRKEYWENIHKLYATALHEMAHSTGHSSRLNRPIENEFGTKEYALEELKADFASTILFQTYGLEQTEEQKKNSLAYLKHWYKILKEDPNQLVYAIKDAEKAVEYIEEHMMNKELVKKHLENKAKENSTSNTKDLPIPKSVEDVKNLTLEEKKAIFEKGFGISLSNTELPTFNDDKTILLGGGVAIFGKEFGEKVNAVEYQIDTDNEKKVYSGNDLYALYKDLSKDDIIHDLTSYGYFKTDVTYYMRPIKDINTNIPLEKYTGDIDRIGIGDSRLSRDDGFFIDYLRMKADENSLDSKIYYEIAKDLVKENVITKPSLEHSPDMLIKAMSVGVLSRNKNFPDIYKKVLQLKDENGKNYVLGDLWKKDSLEIVDELCIQHGSWMYSSPKISKDVLAFPAEEFENRRWEDVLDKSMKSAVELSKLKIFVDKGYINPEILKDNVKHMLNDAENFAIKFNEKYKEIGILRGYNFDTEFRYKDYLASKAILTTISNMENTKTLSPNPIDRIGVKIEWGEFPTTENNKLLIGGAASVFGSELGKAIGGQEYERDVLYSGQDAVDLMKRIEFDNDRIQTSLINPVDKVNLEFYLDNKKVSTHSATLGEWDTDPEKNILFSQLKETNDQDMLRLEGYLKETFANKDDYIHEDPKKISALRKAAGANLVLDSTKPKGTLFELSFEHPDLPKQILETDDVFKPMKELSNFKPIKVEDALKAPVNMPAFPEESIQSQKTSFKKLEDINTFIDLGLGKKESLPEEIQKYLDGASHYYEKCCNKLDEYKEYKELKEKTVTSKEEKDAPVKKINKNVLPKKAKDTEIKKDSLPAGATYPQYEDPVIIDKPKKKELGAKISAPKKERGTTTRKRSGITGGR